MNRDLFFLLAPLYCLLFCWVPPVPLLIHLFLMALLFNNIILCVPVYFTRNVSRYQWNTKKLIYSWYIFHRIKLGTFFYFFFFSIMKSLSSIYLCLVYTFRGWSSFFLHRYTNVFLLLSSSQLSLCYLLIEQTF